VPRRLGVRFQTESGRPNVAPHEAGCDPERSFRRDYRRSTGAENRQGSTRIDAKIRLFWFANIDHEFQRGKDTEDLCNE
jgi:hypothetical protein